MKTVIVRLLKNGNNSPEEGFEFSKDEWAVVEEDRFLKFVSKDRTDIIKIPYERIHIIEIKEN